MPKKLEVGDRVLTVDEDGDLVESTVMSIINHETKRVATDNEEFPEINVRWSENEGCWVDTEATIDLEDEDESA